MSRIHDVFGKSICTLCLALTVLLPPTVQAENKQQSDQNAGQLTDSRGNTYGTIRIEGPDNLGDDRNAPLASVIRYANTTEAAASAGRDRAHGKAIRLKPSLQHNCSQILRGNNRSNFLDGSMSACDETMFGYAGNDIVIGGHGNDSLNGGKGADVITGGGGANSFVYERAGDSLVGTADIITDFKSEDVLDLGGLARTSGVRLTFIGWKGFTGVPGQVNYNITEYWKCDPEQHCNDEYLTVVAVDLTGSGTADFCINLLGLNHPKSRNFVLKSE
ncbi:MAG TPA: M10 family metallopeptidase C-terminal domain-containing protein [Rhizomicrobium sp.]|jgi:hypothetical protein